MAFQDFDLISERRRNEKKQKLKKKIIIGLISSVVVVLLVAGAVFAVLYISAKDEPKKESHSPEKGSPKAASSQAKMEESTKYIKTICSPTDYKNRCETSLTDAVKSNASAVPPKELLGIAVSLAGDSIAQALDSMKTLNFDTPQKKAALDDCIFLLTDAIQEINMTASVMFDHDMKRFTSETADLNNWMSAVMTYQSACIAGVPDGPLRTDVQKLLENPKELSSNAMAILAEISSILSAFQTPTNNRSLIAEESVKRDDGFAGWMNPEYQRLLKEGDAKPSPNITVAKDGSGNFSSVSAALAAIPEQRDGRFVIFVKGGVYEENVVLTKSMVNVTIYGEGSKKSIITGNRNVADGNYSIFQTATFVALGDGFIAKSIGFRNTAGQEKNQAVALRVQSDHATFINCRMDGFQNVLYALSHRHLYRGCYITGTIEIIFGDAAAVFQNCMIYVRKPQENQQNIITAQGRVERRQTTGTVLQNCRILADYTLEPVKAKFQTYLGRPATEYSRTVVMESEIGDLISGEGWLKPIGNVPTNNVYCAEYNNKGTGGSTDRRVNWAGFKKISRDDALKFTVGPFLSGDFWLNGADFPVHFGLSP